MILAAAGSPVWLDVTVGVLLLVSMLGIVVPLLPGVALAWVALAVWAVVERSVAGWLMLLAVSALAAVGFVVKYLVPTRRMKEGGVPTTTLLAGGVLGIIGFFAIPVVGAPLGFVVGVYAAERYRLHTHELAWPSTKSALGAVGLSMLIETTTVAAMAALWIAALVLS
ncbi:MAG: DUF456 domain-containing protein [Microthrixaceae bacterium]|nr:DUF456 domain-containing protein [Microthrixaceae bacterium]